MTTKPRSKIFTIAVRVAVILAASWLGLVVLAVLFQDKLVYHPVKELDLTPGNFGREYEEIWLSAADGTRLNA